MAGRAWWRRPALSFALLAGSAPAQATYSVVGADTATREIGGSGTSCLRGGDVYIIYGGVPGVGVVHSQAAWRSEVHERSVALVTAGLAPLDVIAALSDESVDPEAQTRQFGVVDVSGRSAGFTGSRDGAYAGDRQGSALTFHYSAQGNILTSAAVVSQAATAFEASGCDLAERLMRALEAGAEGGEGDVRCTASRGIPSDSAFVQVDRPGEPSGSYLELHVETSGEDDPLPLLRAKFDTWRQSHPCPAAGPEKPADPGAAGSDADTGREASESACGCRFAGDPARRSTGAAITLGILFIAARRRWNPQRFQC